jgi:hypothetical protein
VAFVTVGPLLGGGWRGDVEGLVHARALSALAEDGKGKSAR